MKDIFDICIISRCRSKVPPNNKMDAAKDMLPDAMPFSFSCDSQVNRCLISQSMFTTILVPFRNTLSISVDFRHKRQVFSRVNIHDQKTINLEFSNGLKLEGFKSLSSSSFDC